MARGLGDRESMPPYIQLGNAIDKEFGGGAAGFLGDQYNPFILPGARLEPGFHGARRNVAGWRRPYLGSQHPA